MTTTIQIWKPITNADIDHEDNLQFYYDPYRQEFVYTYHEGTSLKYSEVITGTPWDWIESPEADFLTAMVPEGDFLKVSRWKRRATISDEQVGYLDWARDAGSSETSGCRFSMALSRKRIVGVDYIPGEVVQGEYCTGYLAVDWNPVLEWMTDVVRYTDHPDDNPHIIWQERSNTSKLYKKVRFVGGGGRTAGLVVPAAKLDGMSISDISRLFPTHEAPYMKRVEISPAYSSWNEAFLHTFKNANQS